MGEGDADSRILFGQVAGHMLGTIDRAVLAAGAAEGHHQRCKAAAHECLHMRIHDTIGVFEKPCDFSIFFQKTDDRLITAGQFPILFITAGIMDGAAVKDIASTIP